jgi:hypothetical protein
VHVGKYYTFWIMCCELKNTLVLGIVCVMNLMI